MNRMSQRTALFEMYFCNKSLLSLLINLMHLFLHFFITIYFNDPKLLNVSVSLNYPVYKDYIHIFKHIKFVTTTCILFGELLIIIGFKIKIQVTL